MGLVKKGKACQPQGHEMEMLSRHALWCYIYHTNIPYESICALRRSDLSKSIECTFAVWHIAGYEPPRTRVWLENYLLEVTSGLPDPLLTTVYYLLRTPKIAAISIS